MTQKDRVLSMLGMAAKAGKVESVVGAINGKFVNILIIDSDCAQALLNYKE